MSVSYDPRQIAEWLDSYTVSKARSYASAVSELRWIDEDTLAGLVQAPVRARMTCVRISTTSTKTCGWREMHVSGRR
jgi:hypothetical protein